jgi:hypothetical protein
MAKAEWTVDQTDPVIRIAVEGAGGKNAVFLYWPDGTFFRGGEPRWMRRLLKDVRPPVS